MLDLATAGAGDSTAGPALLLAHDHYRGVFAKTSHGLVRGPSRWPIAGVIDPSCAGEDAGTLLDGRERGIPIFPSVAAALEQLETRPTVCVVGVATVGGVLPDSIRLDLGTAADAGLDLVNGLHHLLSEKEPDLAERVAAAGGKIVDIRKPRPIDELSFWTGAVLELEVPRVAVLGTDCALGKRTTAGLLRQELRRRGLRAEMVYTGQTGWLQGYRHGFIFDATANDFVSGELERAVLACAREAGPDLILIEGQSGLRNPSGPCGSELVLSARAAGVVLQHAPARRYYEGFEGRAGCEMPSLESEIRLLEAYGAKVWGIGLHTEGLDLEQARVERNRAREELGLPVELPLVDGVAGLAEAILERIPSSIERDGGSLPSASPGPSSPDGSSP
ncbi:MAG: DUF1611 domain-containing protein [Holophagales bacterium]|nr:DUF1611 domain-containing protein [Holophagales bacterium]